MIVDSLRSHIVPACDVCGETAVHVFSSRLQRHVALCSSHTLCDVEPPPQQPVWAKYELWYVQPDKKDEQKVVETFCGTSWFSFEPIRIRPVPAGQFEQRGPVAPASHLHKLVDLTATFEAERAKSLIALRETLARILNPGLAL